MSELARIMEYGLCHEEVTRKGVSQPCEKPAVAVRLEPQGGDPYPVCANHARGQMVSLPELAQAARDDDPFNDPGWLDYADHVRAELVPKIKQSSVTMSLVSGADPDPKMVVETGYMVLLDKPIITVVLPGVKVPAKLAIVSDAIVEGDFDQPERTAARIQAAIAEVEQAGGQPI